MQLRTRLIGAVVIVFIVIGGIVGLFSGPIPGAISSPIVAILSLLPGSILQLLVPGGVVVLGLYYLRSHPDQADRLIISGTDPEQPRNAPRIAGSEFEAAMTTAVRQIRLKGTAYEETNPYQTLRSLTERAVTLEHGCSQERAAVLVDAGEWTDDPIAAAFLGEEIDYPVRFHMLQWAQPATAYERAVERSVTAAQQVTADTKMVGTGAIETPAELSKPDAEQRATPMEEQPTADPVVGGDN